MMIDRELCPVEGVGCRVWIRFMKLMALIFGLSMEQSELS